MRRIAIAVVVGAMVLAACGSSSKKSVAAGGSSTTAAGSGSTTGSTSGGSGGSSDLSALAGQYAKAKIKITYTTGSDSSSFTVAQDGNGKSTFSSDNNTVYSDGKSSVSCEGTGTTAKCTDLGSLGGAAGGIGTSLTTTFAALANVLSTLGGGHSSSESIAGRDASCVTYKASDVVGKIKGLPLFKDSTDNPSDYDPNDTATICLDKDTGFVVKIAGTKKGQAQDELTATAISEPSDSDFTPPVTPVTIPQITIPSG
jgi:hypothetical protein